MKILLVLFFSVCSYASSFSLPQKDMSASFNSQAFQVSDYKSFSIHLIYDGSTPAGTFQIQFSNDDDCQNVSNWVDVDGASNVITDDGQYMHNFNGHKPRCARVKYTRTSGSGTASFKVEAQ